MHDQEGTVQPNMYHTIEQTMLVNCEVCNYQAIKPRSFHSHVKKHNVGNGDVPKMYLEMGPAFKCKICAYKCLKLKTLQEHLKRHRSRTIARFNNNMHCEFGPILHCELCMYQCLKPKSMQRHMMRKHAKGMDGNGDHDDAMMNYEEHVHKTNVVIEPAEPQNKPEVQNELEHLKEIEEINHNELQQGKKEDKESSSPLVGVKRKQKKHPICMGKGDVSCKKRKKGLPIKAKTDNLHKNTTIKSKKRSKKGTSFQRNKTKIQDVAGKSKKKKRKKFKSKKVQDAVTCNAVPCLSIDDNSTVGTQQLKQAKKTKSSGGSGLVFTGREDEPYWTIEWSQDDCSSSAEHLVELHVGGSTVTSDYFPKVVMTEEFDVSSQV